MANKILICDNVKYLRVLFDNKARFENHVNNVVSKANQRMFVIKNFNYHSTKPLACMLFKSLIVSILTYCLPILFTRQESSEKVFKQGDRLGLEIGDLDSVISKQTKNMALQMTHDDEHFINSFLEKLPSGRYRSLKYRTAWNKDSFLRHLILILQDIF